MLWFIEQGSSINHVVKILGIFDPPSWSLLLNKAYVIKWSFGQPPSPLNCPRGLWMSPHLFFVQERNCLDFYFGISLSPTQFYEYLDFVPILHNDSDLFLNLNQCVVGFGIHNLKCNNVNYFIKNFNLVHTAFHLLIINCVPFWTTTCWKKSCSNWNIINF